MIKTKKIVSLLLALVMLLGVMPTAAFARTLDCDVEEHAHVDACYELSCEIAEHAHTNECQRTCDITEHAHTNACQKDCDITEHTHSNDCQRTCDKTVHAHDATCEAECTIEVHAHDDECQRTCNTEEHAHTAECDLECNITEHAHNEECQRTCNITPHAHAMPDCYNLTCNKVEHEHSDDCYVKDPAVLNTNIDEVDFVVGIATEFTFSTVANDDAGVMVVGNSNFSDPDAIELLEYYEVSNDTWYPLEGDFGPATGFPMSDATSKFRVTFSEAGTYTFTAKMVKAGTEEIVCSVEATAVVAPVEYTVTDETEATANGSLTVDEKVAEGEDLLITIVPDDGYELSKLMVNGQDVTANVVDLTYTVADVAANVVVKAEFVEIDDTIELTELELTVTAPAIDALPDADLTVVSTPAGIVADDIELMWFANEVSKDLDDDNWVMMADDEKFVADVYYAVEADLILPDGYALADDAVVTINDAEALIVEDDGVFFFVVAFDKLTAEDDDIVITAINFTVAAPEADVALASTATITTTPANAISADDIELYWMVKNGDVFESVDAGTKAEVGKEYSLLAVIQMEDNASLSDGLVVADTVAVKVNGKTAEFVNEDSVLGALYDFDAVEAPAPKIINGANSEWKDNSKDSLSFRSDAAFADFLKVNVDGKELDKKNYDVKEGSTIVTLKNEYLKTLDAGKHTLGVVSKNGEATTEFTVVHVHELTKVEAKKETCTEKGNKEHYKCDCGKLFEDKDAKTEIVDKTSVEIKAAGHKAATTWSCDSKSHWHKCTVCKEAADEKEAHDFDKETGKICQTCKYDVDNPKTGDESNSTLVVGLMIMAVLGMGATAAYFVYDKKRKQ